MAQIKFTIYSDEVEKSTEKVFFSNSLSYHTTKIDENGNKVLGGYVSGDSILFDIVEQIPISEYNQWHDAVVTYLDEHNERISDSNKTKIEFNIIGVDDRKAYQYEKLLNGKVVDKGFGFYKNLKNKDEKTAWKTAVKSYKKNHKKITLTDKIKNTLDEIKKKISKLDSELDKLEGDSVDLGINSDLLMIMNVLPELKTNPCDFVSDVKRAGKSTIAAIKGVPPVKETAHNIVMNTKKRIIQQARAKVDSQKAIVSTAFDPVMSYVESSTDYFAEIDAFWEEYEKNEANFFALIDACTIPEGKTSAYQLVYVNAETDDEGIDVRFETGHYEPSESEAYAEYRTMNYKTIYNPHFLYEKDLSKRAEAKENIKEALKNLWVPIYRGWEEYARKNNLLAEITVTCGYRPPAYNAKTSGSSTTSPHLKGLAIDTQILPSSERGSVDKEQKRKQTKQYAQFIKNFLRNNPQLQFDQILVEYNNAWESTDSLWVHIGYKNISGKQRREFCGRFPASGQKGEAKAAFEKL